MPRKHAAEKALRQSRKAREQNRKETAAFKAARKTVLKSVEAGKVEIEAVRKAISSIGRAAAHGVIKKNTAARLISRLQKRVNKVSG